MRVLALHMFIATAVCLEARAGDGGARGKSLRWGREREKKRGNVRADFASCFFSRRASGFVVVGGGQGNVGRVWRLVGKWRAF